MEITKKVALGLSGGVDSAVAAVLLKEQGYEVVGVYIECFREEGCRSDKDRKDALEVAMKLGIKFMSLDMRAEYQEKVLQYFYDEYAAGRTPNPDVLCNREIKFGLFYQWAIDAGFDLVATGHYAAVTEVSEEFYLIMAKDEWKDQTYFLNQVPREVWSKVIFPLGRMTKNEVRARAEKEGLLVAQKKDSTGVCFVGEINVREFLKEKLGEKRGDILNLMGDKIGEHEGAWFYTIGQRHGLKVKAQSSNSPPLFVIKKNLLRNQVIMGEESELWTKELVVGKVNWQVKKEWGVKKLTQGSGWLRIRHTGELMKVTKAALFDKSKLGENEEMWRITLSEKVKGVSEGQFAVFYDNFEVDHEMMELKNEKREKVCLGGGVILQDK